MQNITVTLVQTNQLWESKEANLNHFEGLLRAQLDGPTDVIVFPEMFHTSFTMNVVPMAEDMENSIGIQWLRNTAKRYEALCVCSLIVQDDGQFYNRMVAVYPEGNIEYYDKVHLFSLAQEDQYYSPGKTKKIIEFRTWKIALQVCYDLRFPENARNRVDQNGIFDFDLVIYVANWPERRISHWDKLLPARAIENQCYIAAVNRVGIDGSGLVYNGSSQIVNGLGEYELFPEREIEVVQSVTLSYDNLLDLRQKLTFLKDRRF